MTQSLAILAAAVNFAYIAGLVSMHVLPTGYGPISHAVSDYSVGPYAPFGKALVLLSAAGAACLLFALLSAGSPPNLPCEELAAYALLKIVILFFPTDLEGEKLTSRGIVHYVIAITNFTLAVFFAAQLTPILGAGALDFSVHGALAALSLLVQTSIWAVVVTLIPAFRRIFGLFERIFIFAVAAWLVDASLVLAIA